MNTTPSNRPMLPNAGATVVLVDPTSSDGESSLDALHDRDDHVLIVVLVSGGACTTLVRRAVEEGTVVTSVAWNYLERLAVRVDRPGRVVGTIVAAGPDPARELAAVVAENPTDRVVLPASVSRFDPMLASRLAHSTTVAVETVALLSA